MPTYVYECANPDCPTGGQFTYAQSIKDEALKVCPKCGGAVERIIQPAQLRSPRSDTDLRDKGFAKLVRRDKGVYENVTAMNNESRFWHADKPETMPDLSKRITD